MSLQDMDNSPRLPHRGLLLTFWSYYMRHIRVIGITGLAILAAAAMAYAQTTTAPVPEATPVTSAPLDAAAAAANPAPVAEINFSTTAWGDPEAGQTAAGACAACHGADGNPSDPQYPRIAGMNEAYIAKQLKHFATGERNTGMAAVMAPFAQALSAQEMRDVGAYFATQKASAGLSDDSKITEGQYADMKFYEIGQNLFRGGDAERGIPACMACHGPSGGGNPGAGYPHLGGQQQDYVVRRLEEYREGVTTLKDAAHFNMMATVAKHLTDQEIKSLGSYLQGLHNRADDQAPAVAQKK